MNIKIKSIALATMTYVLSTGLTQAALITINTLPVTEDFSNFINGNVIITKQENGQVALDSGAFLSSTSNNSFIGDNGGSLYSLNKNGSWDAARGGFTALNTHSGSMTFLLPFEVNYVGGFMNYNSPPGTNVIISALDSSNTILESYTYILNTEAPISTPFDGVNNGAFRGISMSDSKIKAFQISNGYVVLDDLTFGTVVPVPAAMWLFGSGLLGLVAVARRKVRA